MSKYCACPKNCEGTDENANGDSPVISLANLNIDDQGCGKGYCGVASSGYGDCAPERTYVPTVPDKLICIVEWYESDSDLVKKYLLIYYGVDGTCEIKDMINKQRFLRRLKLDNVTIPQLFLGNILNIYGRQMTIIEYADSCTRYYLEPKFRRAFLMIKPDAVMCLGRILEVLEKQFTVVRARLARFTPEIAAGFFGHFSSQEFFTRLVEHMTSGPVAAFLLVGENAIENLMCLAGENDPGEAKLKHPQSLRAIYGKNIVMNAIHVSESPACVEKDSSYFFTECRLNLPKLVPGTAMIKCATCCIIKPHAVKERLAGQIISYIGRSNYKITAFELFYLDRSHADEFYEIYKGVLPQYSAMTAELAQGPCYVLEISGCGQETPENFREFTGPMDPTLAKKLRPESLRAKFGSSYIENAVHCTDVADDAEMELDYFFRILQMI